MAKTKYNPERVKKICDAIAANGGDEAGWIAGGISEATFYNWLNKYSEFLESIEQARKAFTDNCSRELKITTLERLKDVILNGQRIAWTKTIRKGKTTRSGDSAHNNFVEEYAETIEESVENRGIPQWAVERVLGKPVQSLDDAIKMIESHGLKAVVADAELFRQWLIAQDKNISQDSEGGSGDRGISEETANAIRARILGIPESPADPTPLSSEMDTGQQQS